LFERISKELEGRDYYTYHRAFSPGVQEYVEAMSFLAFWESNTLISKESIEERIQNANSEVQQLFFFLSLFLEKGKSFMITTQDYLLGIADLTGGMHYIFL
jgi:predicted translin family RNA/ssDNA-binding protein